MATPLIEDPTGVDDVSPRYEIGGLYEYQDPTYGQVLLRYYLCTSTAAAGTGDVCQYVAANATAVTPDRDETGFVALSCGGVAVGSSVTTGQYGFYQVAGIGMVALRSDGGVAAGDTCVMHSADDECDTTAAGQEHATLAVALADDGADSVAAGSWVCRGLL